MKKYIPYSEKLKSPQWQKRRLKVMEYAHWRCQICGASDNTLHCHHSYYTKGKEPWQYPDGSIICICQACHEKIHDKPTPKQEPQKFTVEPVLERDVPISERKAKEIFANLRRQLEATPDR